MLNSPAAKNNLRIYEPTYKRTIDQLCCHCDFKSHKPDKESKQSIGCRPLQAILPLCCEAADLGLLIAEIRSRLPHQADRPPPVTLSQQQAETLIMSDHVVSNLLPGKTILIGWEPLKPMKANLEVLRRRDLTWIVDREFEPTTLSLCTMPHAVPYRPDALHFDINIFGCSLDSVCDVFLAHLEALQQRLRGYLMFYIHVDPVVLPELHQICQNTSNASLFREYFEELLLERHV